MGLITFTVGNEEGMALLQAILLAAVVAVSGYLFTDFIVSFNRNTSRINDRSAYVEMTAARAQTLADPFVVVRAKDFRMSDLKD